MKRFCRLRMILSKMLLADLQRAQEQGFGLFILALSLAEKRQAMQGIRDCVMLRPKRLLSNSQRAPI